MKRMTESLGTKIVAVVLVVVLLATLAVSVVGMVFLVSSNAYTDGGAELRRQTAVGYLYDKTDQVRWYYEETKRGLDSTYYTEAFSPLWTNYRFTVTDADGNVLLENAPCDDPQYERTDVFTVTTGNTSVQDSYIFRTEEEREDYLENYLRTHDNVSYTYDEVYDSYTGETALYLLEIEGREYEKMEIRIHGKITAELTAKDELYARLYWIDKVVAARNWLVAAAVVSAVGVLILGIFLLCAAGHKEGVEGIHLNWADRIPFDLYAAILILLALPLALVADAYGSALWVAAVVCVAVVWCSLLLMALVLSFATRAKAGAWWRNTLIYRVLRGLWRLARWFVHGVGYVAASLPLVWKTALAVTVLVVYTFIMVVPYDAGPRLMLWLLVTAVWVPAVMLIAVGLRRLQKGSEALSHGELERPVSTEHLYGELRREAETLNRIGDGMTVAVNERMKSERMKTELITNVSHDIKTPLTSIVNYVDLLKKEQPESETMREYIDVLDRQSARLKKLIEDLVEASKASSGALSVNLVPCEVGILLTQMVGEYEEKAAGQQLELRLSQPEESVIIPADGRHLGRVFDNLMNNICKYSQPATRVYLTLERQGDQAVITFRNISRVPLNISGDELMERFVRGDSSRNTEGSGLGLSIARSLTEVQHGTMDLVVDGDLFKVILTFPIYRANLPA